MTRWFGVLIGVCLVTAAMEAAADPPTVSTRADSRAECVAFSRTAPGTWTSDPRAKISLAAIAQGIGSAIREVKIDAHVDVTCAPPPPPPGSLISDGRPAVRIAAQLVPKIVSAAPPRRSLATTQTIDLRAHASSCSQGGRPPFSSLTLSWTARGTDDAGQTVAARGRLTAQCAAGGDGCVTARAQTRPACHGDRCACGQVCCPYVADPDSACVSPALCRKLRDLHEARERRRAANH